MIQSAPREPPTCTTPLANAALNIAPPPADVKATKTSAVIAVLRSEDARLQMADQEIGTDEIATAAARARNRVIEETIAGARSQAQDMQVEVEARTRLNDLVARGSITSADANRMLQEEITLLPLIAAAAIAEGEAKEKLNQQIADLRAGYAGLAEQDKRSSAQDYLRSGNERMEHPW